MLRGFGAGEPITAPRLLKPGEAGFLAAALTPGLRAASVRIDAVSGDSGFIIPGDRVDILLAERYPITYAAADRATGGGLLPTQKQVNSVILHDVRVLAIDQEMQDLENKPTVGTTATVEVSVTQAQKLALASQMGVLSLALRSLTKADPPEQEGGIVQDLDVSPFLSSVVQRPSNGGGLRVYHGSTVALQWQ